MNNQICVHFLKVAFKKIRDSQHYVETLIIEAFEHAIEVLSKNEPASESQPSCDICDTVTGNIDQHLEVEIYWKDHNAEGIVPSYCPNCGRRF